MPNALEARDISLFSMKAYEGSQRSQRLKGWTTSWAVEEQFGSRTRDIEHVMTNEIRLPWPSLTTLKQ